jgi:hypothetical protein
MPVINDDKTLLILCKCHGHVLQIDYEDWSSIEEGIIWEPEFNISVWNQTPCPFSFSNRIKLIWDLICGKNLNAGDVIIEQEDAQSIINFLTKTTKKQNNVK